MAENHGVLARGIADRALGIRVNVRPADAYGIDAYLDLARSGIFYGLLRETEFALRGKFGNQHLDPL
jgi:hypothetical protein